MMNDKDWSELMVNHELTYLRGDLATSSPESYTIQEMKEIGDSALDLLRQADPDGFD